MNPELLEKIKQYNLDESTSKNTIKIFLNRSISPKLYQEVKGEERLKVLGRGELKAKVEIWAHACSEAAKKGVEAAGGTVNVIA